jgi:hypothetical protein
MGELMKSADIAKSALELAVRRNPGASAEELLQEAGELVDQWRADEAHEREQQGIEDTPCVQSADLHGTGEGRYHGVIG